MTEQIQKKTGQSTAVKKPMLRQMLRTSIAFAVCLCLILGAFFYLFFVRVLYRQYDEKLENVIRFVESNADADDLRRCLETKTASAKYEAFQIFLNGAVDNLGVEYLYLAIPGEKTMINAISATSAEEFAAGAENLAILEESDAYTEKELHRYRSYWDAEEIGYFEESSDWGRFYTAVKPLRASDGETVALICADASIEALHSSIRSFLLFSVAILLAVVAVFVLAMNAYMRHKVTDPLLKLQRGVDEYAADSRRTEDVLKVSYTPPRIESENEVQALAEAFEQMAADLHASAEKTMQAQMHADRIESENRRLAEEAQAAAKIAELTASMNSLFTNIPGLAFSKEVETGKYLACNQTFARFADRSSPEEVAGLTDLEIFDPDTAAHFLEDDKKALEMDGPYVYYENVTSASGEQRSFQTKKLKFTDSAGRACILGLCTDVTEMMQMKEATKVAEIAYEQARSSSVTYSHIAQALAADYSYLYYVDLESDEFIEYSSDAARGALAVETRGEDFFEQSRSRARELIYKDDLPMFLNTFKRSTILHALDEHGAYTLTYRQYFDGEPVYMNMKITRMSGTDRHIIIGVSNVDAQMRYQETIERIQEERATFARITALAGDYICVYTVDPETGRYTQYSAASGLEELGIPVMGEDFFGRARQETKRIIYPEDWDRFDKTFTRQSVLSEIRKNGIFALTYRLILDGMPTYVTTKGAIVNEKDGPQLIIGVNNVDAVIRREQEYEHNLTVARTKANIDALTGVRNKHAYIELEAELNRAIEENSETEFAIVALDVNNLKAVNDTHGHAAGDRLLKEACGIICRVFAHSPVFRVGGDEFTVVSRGEDYEQIDELLAQLRQSNETNLQNGGAIIASGMARYEGDSSVQAVFERADSRMYGEKQRLKKLTGSGDDR